MARPKRSLGQNFLVDPNIQRKIVDALGAGPDDEVLEIGPGRGALTRHLVGRVGRLVLVELDDALAAELERELGARSDVTVLHADFMRIELGEALRSVEDALVVGNIPYNITTPILFRLLEQRPRPRAIVLMIQREVADRILAEPGGRSYGALSVGVRAVAEVERVTHVGRGAFRPVPDVDSTVIRLRPLRPAPLAADEEEAFRTLTREAFSWRRKQLGTTLRRSPEYGLDPDELDSVSGRTGIDPARRPETLSPEEFLDLARALRAAGYPHHLQRDPAPRRS